MKIDFKPETIDFKEVPKTTIDFKEEKPTPKIDFKEGNIDFQPETVDFVAESPKELIKNKMLENRKQFMEHPFKTALIPAVFKKELWQPITETLGLNKPSEHTKQLPIFQPREGERLNPATAREFARITAGQVADIYTTPGTHVIGGLVKGVSNIIGGIKIGGTTLGRIVSKIPAGKGFRARVEELSKFDTWLKKMTPLSSRGEADVGQIATNKIMQALREAKPLRKQQEKLYSQERAKRAGKIAEIGKRVPGEKGFHAQKGALKGELPKVKFEGIREKPDYIYHGSNKLGALKIPKEGIKEGTWFGSFKDAKNWAHHKDGKIFAVPKNEISKVLPPDTEDIFGQEFLKAGVKWTRTGNKIHPSKIREVVKPILDSKIKFKGVKTKITQDDVNALYNRIEDTSILQPFDKVSAKEGLSKLLGDVGGVPTNSEMRLLSEVFPDEFIQTVLDKRTMLTKVGEGVTEVLNIPRALMASTDLSAPFRQGLFLLSHPVRFAQSFGKMFKYAFSEKSYQGLLKEIKSRPTYGLMRQSKLPLTDVGGGLSGREEVFMSRLAERIPGGIGKVVRASDRAYTGFLNKLRADVFDDILSKATKLKIPTTDKLVNDISRFISAASGRGQLPKALQGSAVALNTVFFSPRLQVARLQMINPAFYMKLDPLVRGEALKSLFTVAGLGTTIVSLAKMGGAKVSTDPRNADFGKIKIGNTRYDPWGGEQQIVRTIAQLLTGEAVSSATGVKKVVGEGYRSITRKEILQRAIEMKTAPIASLIITMLEGRSMGKQTIDMQHEVLSRLTPMVIQDMWDIKEELGLKEVWRIAPAIFGVGVQTYSPSARGVVSAMHSVKKSVTEMIKQGRVKEARELWNNNLEFLNQGTILSPYQAIINTLKRFKKDMLKNPNIPKQRKTEFKTTYDTNIKTYETLMEDVFKQLKGTKQ